MRRGDVVKDDSGLSVYVDEIKLESNKTLTQYGKYS